MKRLELTKMIVITGVLLVVGAAVWAKNPDCSVTSKLMTSDAEIKLERIQAQARYDNVAEDFSKSLKVWSARMAATLDRLEKLPIEVQASDVKIDIHRQGSGQASVATTQPSEKRAGGALIPTTQPSEKRSPESPVNPSSSLPAITADVDVVHPVTSPAPASIASSLSKIAAQVVLLNSAQAPARATPNGVVAATGRPGFTERCERIARELEALASDVRAIRGRTAVAHPGNAAAHELLRSEQ